MTYGMVYEYYAGRMTTICAGEVRLEGLENTKSGGLGQMLSSTISLGHKEHHFEL